MDIKINELFLLFVVPFGVAVLNVFLPSIVRKILTFLGLAFSSVLVYLLYTKTPESFNLFNRDIFSINQLGLFALTFIQALSFIILIFSLKGIDKSIDRKYFILYPMTVAFCNGVILSNDIISFIIFWGLSGMAVYLFGILGKTKDTPATSKKTFIIIGGSDAFLIMGLIIMAFIQPGANWFLSGMSIPLQSELSFVAFVFLIIAAFAKAGGFPLHTWVPDFAKDSPVESAALLPASLDKILGIYLLVIIVNSLFVFGFLTNMIIITFGTITVITAVMMAMIQHNGKKLLGYHAVSQVGYMIMGVGAGSGLAFVGGLFHLINHTIYKSSLFLSMGSVEKQTGTDELDELGGLGSKMKITFVMTLIGALSISGIPPFNGFFSKWMIYQGLLDIMKSLTPGFQIWLLICLILAIFGSALTLASFMKFIHAIFLGKRPEKFNSIKETSANQWISTGILSLLCILFGVFAIELPLRYFIIPTISSLGVDIGNAIGFYDPQLLVVLFLIAFSLGFMIYFLTKKVHYDDSVYLGGMRSADKFRVLGTAFYNEVRNMKPLKIIYTWAEKKYFDLYDVTSKFVFTLSRIFQKAHPGQLQLYILYMVIGFLIFLLVFGFEFVKL
ncbi:MAG: hypothetical protein JXA68_07650 [Ignavibacteriales bacterium]|nr:hypothetical protein [Ignavibacteriales bacterium]